VILALTVFLLAKVGFDPLEIVRRAVRRSAHPAVYLRPGGLLKSPMDILSLGLVDVLAAAGLPHILIRLFTVPDARRARSSMGWAIGLIGVFYILVIFLGFGARALLGSGGEGPAAARRGRGVPLRGAHGDDVRPEPGRHQPPP